VHAHFQRWQQGPAWDNKLFTRNLVQVAWSGTNNGAILQPQKTGIGFTSPRQIRVLIIPKALTEADYHPEVGQWGEIYEDPAGSGSSPIRSLTALWKRCLHPRYRSVV
jgi:hypothetical protein